MKSLFFLPALQNTVLVIACSLMRMTLCFLLFTDRLLYITVRRMHVVTGMGLLFFDISALRIVLCMMLTQPRHIILFWLPFCHKLCRYILSGKGLFDLYTPVYGFFVYCDLLLCLHSLIVAGQIHSIALSIFAKALRCANLLQPVSARQQHSTFSLSLAVGAQLRHLCSGCESDRPVVRCQNIFRCIQTIDRTLQGNARATGLRCLFLQTQCHIYRHIIKSKRKLRCTGLLPLALWLFVPGMSCGCTDLFHRPLVSFTLSGFQGCLQTRPQIALPGRQSIHLTGIIPFLFFCLLRGPGQRIPV